MELDLDMLEEMGKDSEATLAIINEIKKEFYPILKLLKEAVGSDLDIFIDDTIKWSAKKTRVYYEALLAEGFSKNEAMQLMLKQKNTNINVKI